jgi:hypothetical protein
MRFQTGTHGLIVDEVPNASLEDLSSRGFARFGVLLKSSTTTWSRGDANANAWAGIMAHKGSATISDVTVDEVFDLALPDSATFGLVGDRSDVITERVSISESEGFGIYHLRGTAIHRDLTASDNSYGAVRLEVTTMAEIDGTLSNNDFGGIIAYAAQDLLLHDLTIDGTTEVLRAEPNRMLTVGDGIQLYASHQNARIERTTIDGSERTGVMLDLFGGSLPGGLFDAVTVTRSDPTSNGVLVQNGTRGNDWDDGLMRDAATVAADDGFTSVLDIVGAVGPCFTPRPN